MVKLMFSLFRLVKVCGAAFAGMALYFQGNDIKDSTIQFVQSIDVDELRLLAQAKCRISLRSTTPGGNSGSAPGSEFGHCQFMLSVSLIKWDTCSTGKVFQRIQPRCLLSSGRWRFWLESAS